MRIFVNILAVIGAAYATDKIWGICELYKQGKILLDQMNKADKS